VTSKGVGMAVPDWPTSYGYNMFALPVSTWFTGGVFHEHTHRLWASTVGVLVVVLTRWLGGSASRRPLALIGAGEIVAGCVLLKLGADWKGAGYFLSGIGGVVLLGAMVWVKNGPASRPLPLLGWLAFAAVQFQGLLGGLRVVLDKQVVADLPLGMVFGLVHACLGQMFLALLCVIALSLTASWRRLAPTLDKARIGPLRWMLPTATALIFLQLVLGASMRHQHAGLAIHDFPLAYGQVWPDTDPASVERYNNRRVEEVPVTAAQIRLQMFHRLGAVAAVAMVVASWVVAKNRLGWGSPVTRWAAVWTALLAVQAALGAFTIWSDKAADIATSHVAVGAISLVTGVCATLVARRVSVSPAVASTTPRDPSPAFAFADPSAR
jgi:cytochrome c oxidase assembly protein subunit 15